MDENGESSLKETESQTSKKQSVPKQEKSDEKENEFIETHSAKKPHNPARDEVISDVDYFKSRVKKQWSDSDSDSDPVNDKDAPSETRVSENVHEVVVEDVHDEHKEDPSQAMDEEEEPIEKDEREQVLETGRLFVRNLPYTATEDDLTELFQTFDHLSQVHLVLDKDTKRSKGYAYILYAFPESAVRALEELDKSIFQGRLLHIMPAQPQKSLENQEVVAASQTAKSLKQQREERRKASEASGDTRAWNSLFLRSDTVVENIARKYGVSKSELLDREADDIAVRIALGETQVIADTKKALLRSGVNVSALEGFVSGKTDAVKRSNHIVLVKHLPYGSSEGDLAKMFGKFGSIDKIILPPTKTLALVVFLEAAEARSAFKGLAYRRYKDAPLYLEWAPSNILSPSSESENNLKDDFIVGENEVKRVILEQHVEGIPDEDVDPDRVESRSLYVKNLNFKTDDECLRKHFSENMKEGSIRSAKVKKHLVKGKNVSKGFGFIEFDSVETAAYVCRDLQGTVLDGHALKLQICHAKKDEQVLKKADKDKSTTKLIVRNVAFEATKKDLRQLFSPFGQIKSLRLPSKFENHRGFAFVEFITKQEVQNAFQALANTHLYGRHLVLERAKEGETLEELRARTAAQFTDEQSGFQDHAKLSKKRKHINDESDNKFPRIGD
ncbi:Multiple rna-binding domain-containing protein [Thalictrum thalictroides]|uniref:Multiple rna-binding domain-containing protein n=1 Tax=Thalictrum thalictroides TaxID=46969 RepID=A0A7J6VIT5_THATH|nr:Multiple rna-binding domain-containing protein [Thalictrum thalictroides]